MAIINKLCVGESLVGDGNEVAHIDLIMGPRGSAAETAFARCLTNNKDGFTSLLAVIGPNLLCKPATVMFNKVTIKGAKQAVQMFGPAQAAVAKAVADIKGGKINFRVDKQANLHFVIGKASFDEKNLVENYAAALEEVLRHKPSSSKGRYLKKIVVSTTTGPGIPVDPAVTRNFAEA